MEMNDSSDFLLLRDLNVAFCVGVDNWERNRKQPLVLTVRLKSTSVALTGSTDFLGSNMNYSTVSKDIIKFLSSDMSQVRSLEALAICIARLCILKCGAEKVDLEVKKPRALLHAEYVCVRISRSRADILAYDAAISTPSVSIPSFTFSVPAPTDFQVEDLRDHFQICNLNLSAIIGINTWEREEKQKIIINIVVHFPNPLEILGDHVPPSMNYRRIAEAVTKHVENSSYKTQEALVESIAYVCLHDCRTPKVTIRVEKPSALLYAASAGCQITRDSSWAFDVKSSGSAVVSSRQTELSFVGETSEWKTVYLALGSNLGNSIANIESALRKLEGNDAVKVLDTSFLYETAAMYVTDQPNFLNAACKISTTLSPENLLKVLKTIEEEVGRVVSKKWGPRAIDLDILLYETLEINTPLLTIPHPRMSEREFVLRPLSDIAANLEHPKLFRTIAKLLALLGHETASEPTSLFRKVIPLSNQIIPLSTKTYIMGILNVTPDSFSDGGNFNNPASALVHATHLAASSTIIDVGGMSTRPNAEDISEAEELARVVPVISALRNAGIKTPLSVDTFRAGVAEAAVAAGANLVNDVTGGLGDPQMYKVMARLGVPVCLMHMRGTPQTMMELTEYNGDVVEVVRAELATCVNRAIACGVRRWNIVVDPGIGFAKTGEQSLQLLKGLKMLATRELEGFPVLVGPSRKRFLGTLTGQTVSKDRVWGTAAACSVAVAGGADFLRVHDVEEMKDVITVADSCWR
ncbi:trifunctional dihydropteroate synthetase [Nowakowskiella sp. JEL0078]|nr:trifunctional dihydropteroate synthetase [Nowakowskiella sp. JEL0078]